MRLKNLRRKIIHFFAKADAGVYTVLLNIIEVILALYGYILIAAAIITWIPDLDATQVGHWLHRLTEPYLLIFRRIIPPLQLGGMMLDLSYIVALIVYFFIRQGVLAVLVSLVVKITS
ncbi:YggT family protein [Alicyclobacillaceae bacterium I2511]|nr:YggT family protein [Alicyclobacillaceae bacterium I2511]